MRRDVGKTRGRVRGRDGMGFLLKDAFLGLGLG